MRCSGLHCGGCRSEGGGGRLVMWLVAAVIGLLVVPRLARSAQAGLSASVADANRVVGLGVAVVLIVAAVTAGGWVLLARRRQAREKPAVAQFSAEVQAALDARDRTGPRRIASTAPQAPVTPGAPVRRVTAYRLDHDPVTVRGPFDGGRR